MLKVSVIIPTYNRAHLVGRAIQSVLNQTYQDFELIVVDDASTDNTEEVVNGFNDERLRYIRHKENKGQAAARNTGIKIARGDYIAFLDSDDEWLPQKLEKQIKAFEKASTEVGVVYTGFQRRLIDGREIYYPSPKVIQKEGNIYKSLLKECFVESCVVLVKKECFNRVGMFDEKLRFCEGWDMWLRTSKYYDFKCIDEPLLTSYYTPNSVTNADPSATAKGWILFLEKHLHEFKKYDRRSLAKRYFDVGMFLCLNENRTQFVEGRKYLQKASKICPLNLRYILFGFISLSGPALFHNRSLQNLYRRLKRISGDLSNIRK